MARRVYVAFGDSITEGYGVTRGFVSYLTEMILSHRSDLELVTFNTGMSGDTSRGGLYRLGRDVVEHRPDLVTINFGVNDAFSGISPEQFKNNLRDMVTRIKDSGCDRIVLLSCESIPEEWAEEQVLPYWAAMKSLADDLKCVYADVHDKWLRELEAGRPVGDLIIPGDLHPSQEGHRLIAVSVFEAMVAGGILEGL